MGQNTWFALNALSYVYFSLTACFGVVSARTPGRITHVNRIEAISFECVRTKTKLKQSTGVW